MKPLKQKEDRKIGDTATDDWQQRSFAERRCRNDKRNADSRDYFRNGGKERRRNNERRRPDERRDRWMRVDKWRSVAVFDE